ncbi:MAG: single-stranded DNA-binding protein [Deltaproteobacteria bacterium]|nr:single-stranded DNA-binding protein [Deltaproteobacteria bacterium]
MSEGLNRIILIGNLGADPELRYTSSGQARLSMRIATTESYLNRDNERKERTDWHHVVVWGKRGEALNKLVVRGNRIGVEGRIQTRSYDDADGKKRYWTEVVATNVLLLGNRRTQGDFVAESGAGDLAEADQEAELFRGDNIPF